MKYKLEEVIKKAPKRVCGENTYPVLSITKDSGLVLQSDRFKKQIASVDQSKYLVVKRGQLVLSIHLDEGVLGIQDVVEEGIVSPAYKVWNVNTDIVRLKYLEWLLKSNYCVEYYKSKAQSSVAGRCNINDKDLLQMQVNIPTFEEQDKALLLIEKASTIIKELKSELQKLNELVKARFVEMFGNLKTNSKKWSIVGFRDCAVIDTNMIHDFDGYENYPHIGIDSIEKETGRLYGYRTIAEDGVISGKYLFTPAHIIYSKIRPNLNKVALPDFDGLCSADAYPILVKQDVCTREYLGYTMRSRYFLDYILAFSDRTNLPKVNKTQVEGFILPLPPIELQQQFTTFIKQLDKSKFAVQKALDKAQLLFDSLMQQYFG